MPEQVLINNYSHIIYNCALLDSLCYLNNNLIGNVIAAQD